MDQAKGGLGLFYSMPHIVPLSPTHCFILLVGCNLAQLKILFFSWSISVEIDPKILSKIIKLFEENFSISLGEISGNLSLRSYYIMPMFGSSGNFGPGSYYSMLMFFSSRLSQAKAPS